MNANFQKIIATATKLFIEHGKGKSISCVSLYGTVILTIWPSFEKNSSCFILLTFLNSPWFRNTTTAHWNAESQYILFLIISDLLTDCVFILFVNIMKTNYQAPSSFFWEIPYIYKLQHTHTHTAQLLPNNFHKFKIIICFDHNWIFCSLGFGFWSLFPVGKKKARKISQSIKKN